MQYGVQEAYLLFAEGRLDEASWLIRAAIFRDYMKTAAPLEVYRRDAEPGTLYPAFSGWADQIIDDLLVFSGVDGTVATRIVPRAFLRR